MVPATVENFIITGDTEKLPEKHMETCFSGCMKFSLLWSHTPEISLCDNRTIAMRESMCKTVR